VHLPISQALPLFEYFAAEGSRERARTGRHQPAPWQPRIDPRRALWAPTVGCLRRFRGAASFQSLLRMNIFRKQFSRSCFWSRRARSCIFRVAVRTMEANVLRLCRRLRPTARFSCLLRLRSLENEEFTSKTALSHLCCSRRAPSSIFKLADRTLKSSVRRVCRRLCLAAPFTRLLRLLTLENDEFTFETGHMWPL